MRTKLNLSKHKIKEFMKGTSYIHNDIMSWMMTGLEGVSRRYILTLIQLITVKELIDISVKNIIELNKILHGKSKTVQTYKKHFRILEKNNLIVRKERQENKKYDEIIFKFPDWMIYEKDKDQ